MSKVCIPLEACNVDTVQSTGRTEGCALQSVQQPPISLFPNGLQSLICVHRDDGGHNCASTSEDSSAVIGT